jgi:hypothetical protein
LFLMKTRCMSCSALESGIIWCQFEIPKAPRSWHESLAESR